MTRLNRTIVKILEVLITDESHELVEQAQRVELDLIRALQVLIAVYKRLQCALYDLFVKAELVE